MEKQITRILKISCPLVQTLQMIEMMVAYHYRANLHRWNAPEKTVKKNLTATMLDKMEQHGHRYIQEDFAEYFNLNEEI